MRTCKPRDKDHRYVATEEKYEGEVAEIILVRGGKQAYLWVGNQGGPCFAAFSGAASLRQLAHAILGEVGHD